MFYLTILLLSLKKCNTCLENPAHNTQRRLQLVLTEGDILCGILVYWRRSSLNILTGIELLQKNDDIRYNHYEHGDMWEIKTFTSEKIMNCAFNVTKYAYAVSIKHVA